ncbi:MAG: dehydrogenase [Lysobacterales bacterium RIFOXYD1_FULL_69_11]|nr:MAG: dehydrogenase [Xanthomonadales bacterium RIFOXYA1_FULL_69_10]OHE87542.1 MAG: dehydrogenase [Xanthomonadales bacterium RIFOXYD1_FULL_69_11]
MAAWPKRLRIRLAGVVACAALLLATTVSAQDLAPIPALDTPVVDTTATLDAAARARLQAQALDLQRRKGSQLQVLVVPTTQPEDIAQYAVRVFDQWRLGREGVDDGVLLLVAKDDRRVRIEVGYGLEGAIPDATASRVVQEYLVPRFREGDYAGGIEQATGVLVGLVDGEPLPPPMADSARERGRSGGGWILAVFAAVFVAQFVRAIFGRAPRPLRGLAGAAASGGVGWLLGSLATGLIGGVIGLLFGLAAAPSGRFARSGHGHAGTWGGMGGGHWGGGGFGGGGGWSGGGGMSGGGGASGSW